MKIPSFYFSWLQKGNPRGAVDRFPELRDGFETSSPGLYCIGDLTGVPLIKLAAESGLNLVDQLARDTQFLKERKKNKTDGIYDLIIVGAGPSGVSASLRAGELGFSHVVLESAQKFNTISNFPTGKPIYVTPESPPSRSALVFGDGTKETLLQELQDAVKDRELPIREGEMVRRIIRESGHFVVESTTGSHAALRVIVAIGKTGNARQMGVAGEKRDKVFTRLIDPGDYADKDILVVGGGDSALEAAIALAETGNRVTLSYRKTELSRPKEENLAAFERLEGEGKIRPVWGSTVGKIGENDVVLKTADGDVTLANHVVYALIGSEIPIQFFRRSNIRMDGDMVASDYVKLAALLLFASVLYFGKSAPALEIGSLEEFFGLPARLLGMPWPKMTKGLGAWAAFVGMVGAGIYLLVHFLRNYRGYVTGTWRTFKYLYYVSMFVLFAYLYVAGNLRGKGLFGWSTGTWYSAMYSLTIVVFGLRRMHVKPTGYIRRQTWTLMLVQVVPLFILPVIVFPFLGEGGVLPDWVMENVFPGKSYWRSYGFILAWPLFLYNLAASKPYMFWLALSLAQTFVVIPYLCYRFGKGAYCGWICSCGALAETLGDEYRTKAPHGPTPKKMENAGQIVLWFVALVSLLLILRTWGGVYTEATGPLLDVYVLVVDIVFAGVLGVGVYFFYSGRIWCRFLCPLAALMHIYTRFSRYRIFSNKKRCISCGICTRVCHMGIDVMGYSSRGIPMDDVECVRCSTCIYACPMDVLTFGKQRRPDPHNREYKEYLPLLTPGWKSGLPEKRIQKIVAEQDAKGRLTI